MTKHFHARLKRWNKMFFGEVFGSTIKAAEKEERKGMTDSLPTTRDAWERDFPGLQTRYLAWCNAMRCLPNKPDMNEFMCWINQRRVAYLKEHQDLGDSLPGGGGEAFTAYLWGR